MTATHFNSIFLESIRDYHLTDDVDTPVVNPYPAESPEHILYAKNWIDTVQWHLEDIIRDPAIEPAHALAIKRRIDASNQQRTDLVEYLDGWFQRQYRNAPLQNDATLNTETPAWAIDRLSILALKIYHMEIETKREGASAQHRENCGKKLVTLLEQRKDLIKAIDQLLLDIAAGRKYIRLYKQMKMYNDESLNPVLYQQKK